LIGHVEYLDIFGWFLVGVPEMGYPNGWMLEKCWKIPKMDDDWR